MSSSQFGDRETEGSSKNGTSNELQSTEAALADLQTEVKRLQESGVKGDLNAILQRIAALHEQNQKLKHDVETKQERIGKLEHKTQEEMSKKMEQIIPWLQGLPELDENARDKVQKGLQDLIRLTAEDSGVWQVVCCASSAHHQNVNRIEQLQREANELRDRASGGVFGGEESRLQDDNGKKRKADVISPGEDEPKMGIWDDFEVMLKRENGLCAK